MTDVGQKTKKAVGKLAQDSFEQIAQEPGEVAKTAKEQVSGIDSAKEPREEHEQIAQEQKMKIKDEQKSQSLMAAHRNELEEIRKRKKIKETQEKINKGESVTISNLEGLTSEQKDALREQKEKVDESLKAQEVQSGQGPLVEPTTKQKRGLIQGMKQKVNQMKTRIETKFKSMG